MNLKYFHTEADIRMQYEDIIKRMDEGGGLNKRLLNTGGMELDERDKIIEELEVLRYLESYYYGFTMDGKEVTKPTEGLVQGMFNRHIRFLERLYRVNKYTVNKHKSGKVKKEYKACRHYLFKFSVPG